MPKISIIVPVYNVERYVRDCMESLIKQTLRDIEIICVDDRGKDFSMKIVKEYAKSDSRIRIIRNWRNRGLSYSRNRAMRYVRSPYIMFCDSDDIFAPDACEKMLAAIETNKSDVAVCGTEVIYEADYNLKASDNAWLQMGYVGTIAVNRTVDIACCCTAWAKIYRIDIIRKHKILFPTGLRYEDEFFWAVYLLWARRITFLSEKLYTYRRRAGSIMNMAYKRMNLDIDHIKGAISYYHYCCRHGVFYDKADWYWGHWFPHMLGSAIMFSGHHNMGACLRFVYPFVKKNYVPNELKKETVQIMDLVLKRIAQYVDIKK